MPVRTLVKSIQNIMRQDTGVDGDAQRISQLCWMFFLKIIDDQISNDLQSAGNAGEYYTPRAVTAFNLPCSWRVRCETFPGLVAGGFRDRAGRKRTYLYGEEPRPSERQQMRGLGAL